MFGVGWSFNMILHGPNPRTFPSYGEWVSNQDDKMVFFTSNLGLFDWAMIDKGVY